MSPVFGKRIKEKRMIDTHCHLEMGQYDNDREAVIQRAIDSSIDCMLTISSDVPSNDRAVALSMKYPQIFATVGVHPHDARFFDDNVYNHLKTLSENKKVVAIGETGLDYHYDHSPRKIQQEIFIRHLRMSEETRLPVIIHCREAADDTISILKEAGASAGVMHCFSGDVAFARRVLDMGLYISIAGPVTFKKSHVLREVAAYVPDGSLLVETDAPYLAPEPFRGKRNEPAYIVHTINEVARARKVTPEDIGRITATNADRLFGLKRYGVEGKIAYKIRNSLYLNITNRCTNRCGFCIRFQDDYVKGHNLRLKTEPDADALKAAIGNPSTYDEVVFCGYGEPTMRLDLILSIAPWIKGLGGMVRINTNGHANIIHKRDITPQLAGIVDSISISLDAQDEETYNEVCKPAFESAFEGVIDFIRRAVRHIPKVTVTAVDAHGVDIAACEAIARNLGAEFRLRRLDIVG